MRIAIPLVDSGTTLAEDYAHAGLFALYEVDNYTQAVRCVGRHSLADSPGDDSFAMLHRHQTEVVLGHDVSDEDVRRLLAVGILTLKDAPLLTPDALIAQLVSGTLHATPPEMPQHQSACGHSCCCACDPFADADAPSGCCGNDPSGCDHTPGCCEPSP